MDRHSSHSQAGTMVRTGLRDMAVKIQPRLVGRRPLPPLPPRKYSSLHAHSAPGLGFPKGLGS